jgi:hypothetical protein
MRLSPEFVQPNYDPSGDWWWGMGYDEESAYGSGGTLDECLGAVFNAIEIDFLTPDEAEILFEVVRSPIALELSAKLNGKVAEIRQQLLRTGKASGEGWSIHSDALEEVLAA